MANNSDSVLQIENYIDGEFVETARYMDSVNPARGVVWAKVPDSGEEELNRAVSAAKKAFETWSKTSVQERSRCLLKMAELLESQLESFAEIESRDQGKPVSVARNVDIPRAVYNLRVFGTAILHHLEMSSFQEDFFALNYTSRLPVGVAGIICPWNLPMYLLTFKIAPALACGNTVVCKPSEMTSVTAWMLCKLCTEAGVPRGVINMVFGTGHRVGDALVRHPDVRVISFTGSTLTAEKIRLATATQCKKLSLELGGKNAAIIFDDVNLEKCIPTVTRSTFINQGEVCLCTSRIFVQRGVFDEFITKFVKSASTITVGDPDDKDTWMGALISPEHLAKVSGYVNLAKEEGATILTGDEPDRIKLNSKNAKGYFFPPTVITNVSDNSKLMQEEIFGPVVCVVPFTTEDEYGLCASIWSQNVNTVHRVARQLQVGTVWANCWLVRDLHMPFGGLKNSGVGREGLIHSVDLFTEVKTVCVQLDQPGNQ
ncbi:hypothetical protein LSH36_43g03042 [Paralvinella palmiformis]|uniref:Aldehyde dehydrogenase domain-containing protein n=1 Tax=Paralvinella palmiformis TaxID=53620 RepID=A0AAD9K6Z1_9ANNE|nr:hypothetical protein LSH36_43g03042 [Paralvinella palmiformis]